VDEHVVIFDRIAVSAGVRGTQVVLAPADYVRACNATLAPILRLPGPSAFS
jgi:Cys-tRNA(Pro)/Cys-tRNA(Cys) deacylase